MATFTEISPEMSDEPVRTGYRAVLMVLDHDDPRVIAVADANGRETPNRRDRVFVESILLAQRSDGREERRATQPRHVDTTNYAGLNVTALFTALKIIHDADRAMEGLA